MKAPSVIIGVGGIGSQICAKVEEQLYYIKNQKKYGYSEIENVRFIAIDTDVNSLRELYRNGFQGKRILLTENMTVEKCHDVLNDSSIDKWYPKNTFLGKKSMTEGAGQQRSISRLAFEYCVRDGRLNELNNIIYDLNKLSVNESLQQTRFYIISSLAGGTGSGVILPLAMYINRFISGEQGDDLAICKGFFILSSAFYASCESALEKKSLDANAYAAIKELSAFMRSADNNATSKVQMSYPLPLYGDYKGATYEYCYLFGMTNENAKRVRSFADLKDIVADAVYMQACSPMHDRNSSREDNSLRHAGMLGQKNQESWLRRFGGIGCGRLLYPYKDLAHYFGLRWAKDTMEQEWQRYDIEYRAIRKVIKDRGKNWKTLGELDQGEYYIRAINKADTSDYLAEYVRLECQERKEGYPWQCYLKALEREAVKEIEDLKNRELLWSMFELEAEIIPGDKKNKFKEYRERYERAEKTDHAWNKLRRAFEKQKNALISDIRLFRFHSWQASEGKKGLRDCFLEYWLINDDGRFFHPNSVRYFLYQLEKEIISCQQRTTESMDLQSPFIQNEKNRLSYKKGVELREAFLKKRNDMLDECINQLKNSILDTCADYVKKLIRCYEEFYGSYDMILDEFDADIQVTEKKLDQDNGTNHAYVCADSMCRERLHEELSDRRSYDEGAVSNVSYELFRLIHHVGLEFSKLATRECANAIKEFWSESIVKEEIGKEILDMNILEAMNKEEECRSGRKLSEQGFEDTINAVKNTLVAPFVKYFQHIDMNTGISLCCYHTSLKNMVGVYRNVVDWLNGHDAVDDDTYCSKQEIMFYHSFVGLEAYEVLDYLHGISARTAVRGSAFQSYLDVLENMGKMLTELSKVITPHADSRWHDLDVMPDPSKKYQEEQEHYIAVAFLYAWIKGNITYDEVEKKYRFTLEREINLEHEKLYDCHRYLYGNYHWTMRLLQSLQQDISNVQKNYKDKYYEQIVCGEKPSPFEVIFTYQTELCYGERNDEQRWLLADAAKMILLLCIKNEAGKSQRETYINMVKVSIEQASDNIHTKRYITPERVLEDKDIDKYLADEILGFFKRYVKNLLQN